MRKVGIALVIALAWAVFVFAWLRVLSITSSAMVVKSLILVTVTLVVCVLVTAGWVRYNIRLHARKPQRAAPAVVAAWPYLEALGRIVHGNGAQVLTHSLIEVHFDGKSKLFAPPRGAIIMADGR